MRRRFWFILSIMLFSAQAGAVDLSVGGGAFATDKKYDLHNPEGSQADSGAIALLQVSLLKASARYIQFDGKYELDYFDVLGDFCAGGGKDKLFAICLPLGFSSPHDLGALEGYHFSTVRAVAEPSVRLGKNWWRMHLLQKVYMPLVPEDEQEIDAVKSKIHYGYFRRYEVGAGISFLGIEMMAMAGQYRFNGARFIDPLFEATIDSTPVSYASGSVTVALGDNIRLSGEMTRLVKEEKDSRRLFYLTGYRFLEKMHNEAQVTLSLVQ